MYQPGRLVPKRLRRRLRTPKQDKEDSVTALADWLSLPPMTPDTVRSFLRDPLRAVLPGRDEIDREVPLMVPGLERC